MRARILRCPAPTAQIYVRQKQRTQNGQDTFQRPLQPPWHPLALYQFLGVLPMNV